MAESKAAAKKEIDFMKKKGAPKSMIKQEEKEMAAGMKRGGSVKGAKGGVMPKIKTAAPSRDGVAIKGKTKGKTIAMKRGGKAC